MRRLTTADEGFDQALESLLAWEPEADAQIVSTVQDIINNVRRQGDEAVLEYTQRFDRWQPASAAAVEMSPQRLEQAWQAITEQDRQALQIAAQRVEDYAQRQKLQDWSYTEADGSILGQQVRPLDRVGIYVPGGKASYPSSVIMNAVPAQVAGVAEIIMVVPTPDGQINELVLAAAKVAGVSRVFTIGGAQAVAALAYGTQTIPAVDKIVGPGNIYVATAKRLVFGQVGIDMVAGPSEVLVLADASADPDWLAMDMFAQAEHDEDAQALLVATEPAVLDAVEASIEKLLPTMEREAIIRTSLKNRGALIQAKDQADMVRLANFIAAEHLELGVAEPDVLLPQIKHAGAIFVGHHSAEVLGDYCAGPNHVLPTSRTARFFSPLGVYDFQKRSSIVRLSTQGANTLAPVAEHLAKREGLTGHARSAALRAGN